MRLRVALAALALALASCAALRPLPAQAEQCAGGVVPDVGAALFNQAMASAEGTPGAPSWASFSKQQLLSNGMALALCIGEALLHDLDAKLPSAAQADASGHVTPASIGLRVAALGMTPAGADGPACPDPVVYLAHDRVVDFLEQHGVEHQHRAAGH